VENDACAQSISERGSPSLSVGFEVRVIGVIAAEQADRGKKEQNDRLLGPAPCASQLTLRSRTAT